MKNILSITLLLVSINLFAQQPINKVSKAPEFYSNTSFPEFIESNIKYPTRAILNNIEGTVNVKFTVTGNGKVKNVKPFSKDTLGYGLENALMNAVLQSTYNWIPGKKFIKKADIEMKVSYIFSLPDTVTYFNHSDKQPQFPGGYDSLLSFTKENITFDTTRTQDTTDWKTEYCLLFNEDGSFDDVRFIRNSGPDELINLVYRAIIAMPKWSGGSYDGIPIKMQCNYKVVFSYSSTHKRSITLSPTKGIEFDNIYTLLLGDLNYPDEAIDSGVEGTVFVSMRINEYGEVSNVKPAKDMYDYPLGYGLEEEAMRVLKKVKFSNPIEVCFHPIPFKFIYPIEFVLE